MKKKTTPKTSQKTPLKTHQKTLQATGSKRLGKTSVKEANSRTTSGLLKAFREKFAIKQEDMAHACRISQANLSAIEQGRREIGARLALRLAAFIGVRPDEVLYPAGYAAEREYVEIRSRAEEFTSRPSAKTR